jgi:MoxR-like ATPase
MTSRLKFLPRDLQCVRIDRQPDAAAGSAAGEVIRHVFDIKRIAAVNGALAAGRPLLVRGEPGVGKTQLAAAVAAQLQRPLVSFTVNSRTESTDLLWRFDAVRRLAEAQICGVRQLTEVEARDRLAEWKFVEPGPLWWGFDWHGAASHLVKTVELQGDVPHRVGRTHAARQ